MYFNIMYKKGLFVFRRDLRIYDNTGLIEACKLCEKVYCLFIFDLKQITKVNKYFSPGAFLFMLESIKELQSIIPVNLAMGDPVEIIVKLIKTHKIDLCMFNEDYTPYAMQRDINIITAIKKLGDVSKSSKGEEGYTDEKASGDKTNDKTIKFQDVALNAPYIIKPYKVFTPYYNVASKNKVSKPDETVTICHKLPEGDGIISNSKLLDMIKDTEEKVSAAGIDLTQLQRGGRTKGLECLHNFKCNTYKDRDMLCYESSRLSPHLKFGTLSCREVYHACNGKTFRKQLYWRDFYMQIAFHFPHVFGNNFKDMSVKWSNDKKLFKAWCDGKTGYDIVDACMNQLNTTGYMHNRGRMIVANFLTKILRIDWKWGEKYFATRLTDYDPCNNNGGWQWSAGTGADAQPYYRIFNPMLQQKKFDPDGLYVAKWLPKSYDPIIDYVEARDAYLKMFKK
jgi:deoxyribodipyrimidine photo-lyase